MGDSAQRVSLPIFPLHNVVLFPGVQAPLHIFEPRYREMTADALAGDGSIGMVAVRPDGAETLDGDPPLHPYGCAGTVRNAEVLEDGRFNILLLGTQRFRIETEAPRPEGRLYRVAEVTFLADVVERADEAPLHRGRREVIDLFSALVRRTNPERAGEINDTLFAGVDDVVFTNTFCQLLELEPVEKQGLLQTDRVVERCEQLATLLRFRLAELSGQLPGGDRSVH